MLSSWVSLQNYGYFTKEALYDLGFTAYGKFQRRENYIVGPCMHEHFNNKPAIIHSNNFVTKHTSTSST